MTLEDVISLVKSQGYEIDTTPFKLNVVGIRDTANTEPILFQDEIAYFYYDQNGNLVGKVARGTTSPSVYYLQNPINSGGAAILKQGQYKDSYAIGLHRGKYKALVQVKPVTVIRDKDRNSYLDFFASTTTGLYGINIHKATIKNNRAEIGTDSAGCQVFMNIEDFDDMMKMADTSRIKNGNTFTYTLIDKKEIIKKRLDLALVGAILIGLTGYVYYLRKKKVL
jgi:hypothetical protein